MEAGGLRSGKNALQVGEHGLHHGGDGTCLVVLGSLDGFAGHESQLLKTCSVHFERRNQCVDLAQRQGVVAVRCFIYMSYLRLLDNGFRCF